MRFLFATIQGFESAFYGVVGAELARRGHEVEHLTVSRRASRLLRERGFTAHCLPELIEQLAEPDDLRTEAERVERQYGLPTIRDVYRTDPPSDGRSEEWCIRRTLLFFRAVEQLFDRVRPDLLVPEVGSELPRTVAHLVALDRGVRTLFLFYTIFPRPLRLYVDTMHAPIVPLEELRELRADERKEVESFVHNFKARATPIRKHRRAPVSRRRVRQLAAYVGARVRDDRENEYLRPGRWVADNAAEWARALAARAFYREPRPDRSFVYFPLHVTDDYKIKRVIPHCVDQPSIIELVADALPPGYDLVLKEHPLSIGRNKLAMLRRVTRRANIRLVEPHMSSHELIRRSSAVVVISSTVGLEALLYAKPVLTLGRPFYAGYGLTVDLDSFAGIREQVPALLRFQPDRERILRFVHAAMRHCGAGAPVLVDRSNENALVLAGTLDAAARKLGGDLTDEPLLAAGTGR